MGNGYERRGQEFADELHSRSRESAFEYRKLLTSLATGALALFFLALTAKIEPALTQLQLWLIGGAIVSMAVTVVSGLYCWNADAQRNYFWAKVEEGKQESGGPEFDTLSKSWKKRLNRATVVLRYSFGIGIAFSVVYMAARVFGT